MSKSKVQPESEAKHEELQYILMSGKHSRRQPDGTSITFRPGDIVPNLSDEELSAFGDKFVTVEQFEARVAGFNQAQQSETVRRQAAVKAKAKANTARDAPRDGDAENRAEKIAEMREVEQPKQRNLV